MTGFWKIIRNWAGDKDQRASDCFLYLKKQGVELCSMDGTMLTIEQASTIGVGRIDFLGDSYLEYCEEAFYDKGYVKCSEKQSDSKINEESTLVDDTTQPGQHLNEL